MRPQSFISHDTLFCAAMAIPRDRHVARGYDRDGSNNSGTINILKIQDKLLFHFSANKLCFNHTDFNNNYKKQSYE
jgi:hypothetical protein